MMLTCYKCYELSRWKITKQWESKNHVVCSVVDFESGSQIISSIIIIIIIIILQLLGHPRNSGGHCHFLEGLGSIVEAGDLLSGSLANDRVEVHPVVLGCFEVIQVFHVEGKDVGDSEWIG